MQIYRELGFEAEVRRHEAMVIDILQKPLDDALARHGWVPLDERPGYSPGTVLLYVLTMGVAVARRFEKGDACVQAAGSARANRRLAAAWTPLDTTGTFVAAEVGPPPFVAVACSTAKDDRALLVGFAAAVSGGSAPDYVDPLERSLLRMLAEVGLTQHRAAEFRFRMHGHLHDAADRMTQSRVQVAAVEVCAADGVVNEALASNLRELRGTQRSQ